MYNVLSLLLFSYFPKTTSKIPLEAPDTVFHCYTATFHFEILFKGKHQVFC